MREPGFNQSELTQTTQTAVYGTPAAATAGAITTRAAAEAFFVAGTNRAMFRFTLMNHMCMDMEQVLDTIDPARSHSPRRVAQPRRRQPRVLEQLHRLPRGHGSAGAGVRLLQLRHDVRAAMVYDTTPVHPKYFNNDTTFADGFVTPNDSWHNHWRQGQNALIGWNPAMPGQGSGAKSLGEELAGTQAFAQCQVKKVFKAVCLRDPVDANDRTQINTMTNSFRRRLQLETSVRRNRRVLHGQLAQAARELRRCSTQA